MTSVAFQSILRKQIRKLPKIVKFVKIIQYYCPYLLRNWLRCGCLRILESAVGKKRGKKLGTVIHNEQEGKREARKQKLAESF